MKIYCYVVFICAKSCMARLKMLFEWQLAPTVL